MSDALYPALEPRERGMLRVSALHALYYEVCGAGDGAPALFLHGGPGSSIGAAHRRFFDPAFYRIVLFDQRGCGQSTPRGETRENTLADLVADIESLRQHLRVQRWLLFGGSWGSTLALVYAQRHPERVSGLVLRGAFLASDEEVGWYLSGLRRFLPEAQAALAADIGAADLLAWYCGRIEAADPAQAQEAARRWAAYESAVMAVGEAATAAAAPDGPAVLARVRVQLHYLANRCFLEPGELLAGLRRLQGLPALLVQGRRDLVCPPVTAYELARRWPGARLRMVEEGGHSALHPAMARALVQATDDMRGMLSGGPSA
jgi:proline iminopeptidase